MTKLYTFRDRVSGLYSAPFMSSDKKEVVLRSVRTVIERGSAEPWATYPADHELYCVGVFDADTGVITATDKPDFVVNLSDILEV